MDNEMLRFFSRCIFGAGCKLSLYLHTLSSESAPLLTPLFDLNTFSELTIYINQACMNVLAAQILRIPVVIFPLFAPAPSILDLGLLPRVVNLPFPTSLNYQKTFWDFVDAMLYSGHQYGNRVVIKIHHGDHGFLIDDDFDWLVGSNSTAAHAAFIRRLLPAAVALFKRGLVITDRYGRDVTSLTQI
jgi:hypothetical protein